MDIRSRVMSALRWSAASRLLGQLVSWAITIVVIRLLAPDDYGLMAMAMVVVSLLILLNTWGLDAVLVQEQALDEETRRQVFGAVILINLCCFCLVYVGAGFIAAFYGEPGLAAILRALSLQFLLLIFETLPQSELERKIEFAGRSIVEFATLVLGSLVTLALALAGFGVWALVWGTLAANATRVIGLNLISRNLLWPRFHFSGMRRHFSFGGFVTLDRGLWFLFAESDKFIGGKLLGNHLLGFYAVASQLASLPIDKVSGILNAVAFPAFSRVHAAADHEAVRRYLLMATRLLAVAAFPVFFGISCTAQPLVVALLGAKWLPAAPVLQLLALIMPFRLLSNVFPPLLWGVGHPRTSASNLLIAAVLMPLAFLVGARWGVAGMACAWLGMYPVVFLFTAVRTCRLVAVPFATYAAQLGRPLAAAISMYVVVTGGSSIAAGAPGDWLYLVQLVFMGAVVYPAVLFLLDRAALRETLQLLWR